MRGEQRQVERGVLEFVRDVVGGLDDQPEELGGIRNCRRALRAPLTRSSAPRLPVLGALRVALEALPARRQVPRAADCRGPAGNFRDQRRVVGQDVVTGVPAPPRKLLNSSARTASCSERLGFAAQSDSVQVRMTNLQEPVASRLSSTWSAAGRSAPGPSARNPARRRRAIRRRP